MNNFENIPDQTGEKLNFDGSWEIKNRNLKAAAIFGLLGIGVFYFYAQTILAVIFIFIENAFSNPSSGTEFLDRMQNIMTEYKASILAALAISQYFVMLLPALWIVKKWHTSEIKKYIRFTAIPLRETLLAVLITISAIPFSSYLSDLLIEKLNVPESLQQMGAEIFTAHSIPEFIVLIFIIAVTPAICEETLFRGYFQRTLERTSGFKSVIWTGVVFGLFHMQPIGLVSLSILGLLFSFFYYRSKSLFPSSAAHFTNNFLALLFMYFAAEEIEMPAIIENASIYVALTSLAVTSVLLWLYIKITDDIERI